MDSFIDDEQKKSKILIIGATGYIGEYMVKASISMGHPTYAYVRPIHVTSADHYSTAASKLSHLHDLQQLGLTIIHGELDEQEKLVCALRQVDIVISTISAPQHLEQLKIITAIKQAPNIKRFVPSEYGNEVDRVRVLAPFQVLLENKKKIRRATEAAGVPYTFVAANSCASYFINYLLHPHDQLQDQVTVYGTGHTKVAMSYEEDIATYTVKAANDPRAANRQISLRLPGNMVSQLDLISAWEEKTGRTLIKNFVPEEEMVKLSQTLSYPDNIRVAILHSIFIKGDQTNFELRDDDLEASKMYPDHSYTSIDALLEMCLVDPPKPKLAALH